MGESQDYSWESLIRAIGEDGVWITMIKYWECEQSTQEIMEGLHLDYSLEIFDAQVYAEDVIPALDPEKFSGERRDKWVKVRDEYREENPTFED